METPFGNSSVQISRNRPYSNGTKETPRATSDVEFTRIECKQCLKNLDKLYHLSDGFNIKRAIGESYKRILALLSNLLIGLTEENPQDFEFTPKECYDLIKNWLDENPSDPEKISFVLARARILILSAEIEEATRKASSQISPPPDTDQ